MNKLISHATDHTKFEDCFENRKKEILEKYSSDAEKASSLLKILNELSRFELGRFLIVNRGMNGRWTDYVCNFPENRRKYKNLSELELFILDKRPLAKATQERYQIARRLTQMYVRSGVKMATIPSGVASDLLTLDYEGCADFELTAIDLDDESLSLANDLADKMNLAKHFKCVQKDAWQLDLISQFNVICSSGLNIYVKDTKKVIEFYNAIFNALIPNGVFIGSFMNTRPWVESEIDEAALKRQQEIYSEVLGFTGSNLRSKDDTLMHLQSAGFKNIEFHFDRAGIFPCFVACRATQIETANG